MTEDRLDEHLAAEEVAAYVDGALAADERARAQSHLARCFDCRAEVLDVSRLVRTAPDTRRAAPRARRIVARIPARRVWASLAAAAVVLLWVAPRARHAPGDDVHRDQSAALAGTPRPVAPVGRVGSARALVWSQVPGADRYRATLFDTDGRVLYETQPTDTSAALPDSIVLAVGASYLWKVEARIGWNRWEPSELVEFSVAATREGGR